MPKNFFSAVTFSALTNRRFATACFRGSISMPNARVTLSSRANCSNKIPLPGAASFFTSCSGQLRTGPCKHMQTAQDCSRHQGISGYIRQTIARTQPSHYHILSHTMTLLQDLKNLEKARELRATPGLTCLLLSLACVTLRYPSGLHVAPVSGNLKHSLARKEASSRIDRHAV